MAWNRQYKWSIILQIQRFPGGISKEIVMWIFWINLTNIKGFFVKKLSRDDHANYAFLQGNTGHGKDVSVVER
jgi:hypothetical protein